MAVLQEVGARASSPAPFAWRVDPGEITGFTVRVEPDLSNAGPFLCAAALTAGEVSMEGWPLESTQIGKRWPRLLEDFGCETTLAPTSESTGTLTVHGPEAGQPRNGRRHRRADPDGGCSGRRGGRRDDVHLGAAPPRPRDRPACGARGGDPSPGRIRGGDGGWIPRHGPRAAWCSGSCLRGPSHGDLRRHDGPRSRWCGGRRHRHHSEDDARFPRPLGGVDQLTL